MKVQYTRPHEGGAMSEVGTDSMVEELPDVDAAGNATPVPPGATLVDPNTATHGWQWDQAVNHRVQRPNRPSANG